MNIIILKITERLQNICLLCLVIHGSYFRLALYQMCILKTKPDGNNRLFLFLRMRTYNDITKTNLYFLVIHLYSHMTGIPPNIFIYVCLLLQIHAFGNEYLLPIAFGSSFGNGPQMVASGNRLLIWSYIRFEETVFRYADIE